MTHLQRALFPRAATAILASALMSGCIGAEASQSIPITIHYSRFTPDSITVLRGIPVTFVLVNEDPIEHEWIVGDDALHAAHRTGTEPHHGSRPTEVSIAPMETVSTTVTFPSPGKFTFVCHLPAHEAYGMVGTIDVR